MKTANWRRLGVVCAVALASLGPVVGQEAESAEPPAFDKYWMVFLQRGENPPDLDEESSRALQMAHLGHLRAVYERGDALVAGPFEVPSEETLRGIVLFRGDLSRDEVVELASADPAVEAGRLQITVFRWWTGADVMEFRDAEALASHYEEIGLSSGDEEEGGAAEP